MNAWAITDKGSVRSENQDTFFVCCDEDKNTALLAICDGMGGAASGDIASKTALNEFISSFKSAINGPSENIDFPSVLRQSVLDANSSVFKLSRSKRAMRGMGTTLVSAFVMDDMAFIANVGDSRAYLISDNEITRITQDHSLVEDMISRGEISEEQARIHPNRNLITRAVGTSKSVEADIFSVDLNSDDYLFLCSDGLSNCVEDEEILHEILIGNTISETCDRLLKLALSRGGYDNITMVILKK